MSWSKFVEQFKQTDPHASTVSTAQYQTTNDRRSKNFEFFWQAVALSLAAQAFLMTIALSGSASAADRYFACSLSIAVSIAAISLMRSQKNYQDIESRWLDLLESKDQHAEKQVHSSNVNGRFKALREAEETFFQGNDPPYFAYLSKRQQERDPRKRSLLSEFLGDASKMWQLLMVSFALVDVAVILITWTGESIFR